MAAEVFDNFVLVVTEGGAVVVVAVLVAVTVGSGVSLVSSAGLTEGIGGKSDWTLLGLGVVRLEAVGWTGIGACGWIRMKAKQNTETISNGGPIRNRCEVVICLELSIMYCAKLCPLIAAAF